MSRSKEMTDFAGETLAIAGECMECEVFEPSLFMHSFLRSKKLCSEDTSDFPLSNLLLTMLHRTHVLFFASLGVKNLSEAANDTELLRYSSECIGICRRTVGLYPLLFYCDDDFYEYTWARNLAFADNEALRFEASKHRLLIAGRHSRIFSALPCLEVVYSCTELLEKCRNLCRAFDAVNNKFTLCT